MSHDILSRRKLLSRALMGGVGGALALEQLGGIPGIGHLLSEHALDPLARSHDSFKLLADAMRGGTSLLRMQQAFAQSSSDQWSVVTVKIANHVHTPLVFKLGAENEPNPAKPIDKIMAKHPSYGGLDTLSADPALRKMKVNSWFGNILTNTAGTDAANRGVGTAMQDLFAPLNFGTGNVALQCALHLQQSVAGNNHSMRGFKIRENLPDLAKFVVDKNIITSPLGVTCFMMGDRYDKAEGANFTNIVCDAQGERPFLNGKSVNAYYQNMNQSKSSYVTDPKLPLTKTFDKLVKADGGKLRDNMIQYQEQLNLQLDLLRAAASLEAARANLVALEGQGAMQSIGNGAAGAAASSEFLSQCAFTLRALKMSDKPLRNFSLFLNISDLDGQNLDAAFDGGAGAGVKALTYVEGMRQLAMGLNMFGKAINEGAKVLVLVISEGGRSESLGDDKISFGMVMGPKNPLQNALYCNTKAIESAGSAVAKDPGSSANGSVPWNMPGLVNSAAAPIDMKLGIQPTQGDLQLGVAQYLAERLGVTLDLRGLGNYVDLKAGKLPA